MAGMGPFPEIEQSPTASSFGLDARRFDDGPPFRDVRPSQGAQRLGSLLFARWNLLGEVGEP
jgi:hypothetical protein